MDTPTFASFKPIVSFANQNKEDIAQYYTENNLTPNNDYMNRYLSDIINLPKFEAIAKTPSTPTTVAKPVETSTEVSTEKLEIPTQNTVDLKSSKSLNDKGKQIINFYMSKGLTKAQAAGIAGNYHAESSFNTNALGDNGLSFGLAQWRGPRLENLKRFSASKGLSPNSVEAQLEFTWHELQTSENPALQELLKTNNPKDAARIFSNKFERPKTYNISREIKAEQFFSA